MKFKRNLMYEPEITKETSRYETDIYTSLCSIDPLNSDRIKISETIAKYLSMFKNEGIDADSIVERIEPILEKFKGVNNLDSSEKIYLGDEVFGQFIPRDDLSSDIILNTSNFNDFKHYAKYSFGYLLSSHIEDGKITQNLKDYPVINKLFNEFYTERLEVFEFVKLPKHQYTLETEDSTLNVITSSKEYFPIGGYSHILDSVLHKEIMEAKLLNKDSLEPYRDYLIEVNNRLDNILSLGPDRALYEEANKSMENLLAFVLVNKYKDMSHEDTYKDYIDLRNALSTYGEVSMQKEMISNLDSLMLERFLGHAPEEKDLEQFTYMIEKKNYTTYHTFKEEFNLSENEMKSDLSIKDSSISNESLEVLDNISLIRIINENLKDTIYDRLFIDERESTNLSSFKVSLDRKDNIKENAKDFFKGVLSSMLHSNKSFEDIVENFENLSDFNLLKDSKGDNFLLYVVKDGFSSLQGELDERAKESVLKEVLSNGFSMLDKDSNGKNAFSYFMEKEKDSSLRDTVYKIVENSGELPEAIDKKEKVQSLELN